MLKGFNRRVVVMKNTGSDLFDEAYFIVKENKTLTGRREVSAVDEARDIILGLSGKRKNKRFPLPLFKDARFLFFAGVLTGAIFTKIIFI